MPFDSDEFRQFRLGIYGSIGDASDVPMASQFDLVTRELSVTYFDAKLIDPNPAGSRSSIRHLLADVMWKF